MAVKREEIQRWEDGYEVGRYGSTARFEFWYPGTDDQKITHLEVGLMHVRAADNIRIHYDFQRDGWSVEQASTFEWSGDDPVCDPDWQEVAFVPAWSREKPNK